MATLKTTTVNGTLNVTKGINVNNNSVSWMYSFDNPSIKLNALNNKSGYSPWIAQSNKYDSTNIGYTMGIYQNRFKIIGANLPKTTNGYDIELYLDISANQVYTNNTYRAGSNVWAGSGLNDLSSEKHIGAHGGAGIMYIYSQSNASGKMGIYATTASNSNVGWMNVTQNGQVTLSYTNLVKQSDKRLKSNITDLLDTETKTILVESKIKKFTMKSDLKPGNFQYGVLAQDLRDTLKNNNLGYRSILRITDKETKLNDITDLNYPEEKVEYGVDYTQYIPILIKGWQIHETKINQLEQRIKELENK